MKRIVLCVICWLGIMNVASVRAGEYNNGAYFGGKLGVNVSRAAGETVASKKSTVAYGLQGGYLQGGYIFDSRTLVLAVGAYLDGNPSEQHDPPHGVTYGSRAYGLDAKIGLPLGPWMPYAKLGYGYSSGTKDLAAVAQNSLNGALGLEYKFAPQWSALGEMKVDGFSSQLKGTSITNKTYTFGITYYFEPPPVVVVAPPPEVEEVDVAPAPVAAPVPVEDAPPI